MPHQEMTVNMLFEGLIQMAIDQGLSQAAIERLKDEQTVFLTDIYTKRAAAK